mmetsp:Transcript_24763/g.57221  ORF Transcript_24763/g.57221 Transcript_24763/m.57221 type:complete len:287 (+) Transcript_24763:1043-1903(+)
MLRVGTRLRVELLDDGWLGARQHHRVHEIVVIHHHTTIRILHLDGLGERRLGGELPADEVKVVGGEGLGGEEGLAHLVFQVSDALHECLLADLARSVERVIVHSTEARPEGHRVDRAQLRDAAEDERHLAAVDAGLHHRLRLLRQLVRREEVEVALARRGGVGHALLYDLHGQRIYVDYLEPVDGAPCARHLERDVRALYEIARAEPAAEEAGAARRGIAATALLGRDVLLVPHPVEEGAALHARVAHDWLEHAQRIVGEEVVNNQDGRGRVHIARVQVGNLGLEA